MQNCLAEDFQKRHIADTQCRTKEKTSNTTNYYYRTHELHCNLKPEIISICETQITTTQEIEI